jgi:hypothetical protein
VQSFIGSTLYAVLYWNGCSEHLVLFTGVTPLFILQNLSKLALMQVLSVYHFVIEQLLEGIAWDRTLQSGEPET